MPRVAIRRTRASKTRGKSCYQGKGKEEGIYCAATMHSFVSVSEDSPRPYDSRILRLDTVRPWVRPEIKLREWFSSFTRIPFTRYSVPRLRGKRISETCLLRSTNCSFFSPRRIGEAESSTGRFYSILVQELLRNG